MKNLPDRPKESEEKYVDLDESTGMFCVFDLDSGYSSHAPDEYAN